MASIVGSVGIVFVIAMIVALQKEQSAMLVYQQYFDGGQMGLSILAISGGIFIALFRHPRLHAILSLGLYAAFVIPVLATGIIIGMNPGFESGELGSSLVNLLWLVFWFLHILWLFVMLLEPRIPTAQEAGDQQENRVNDILTEGD
ncbi:hypothetical protein [Qipengyuania aquimaris]|uniref:hypothetical protein n=1 Tax=Qipengyuania aquimaris TaxID=255984 RepID=UPI001CD23EC7|nr:hypothetical protein [Qipengyuania aquimaris]MCA0904410.1 hypothetical protein [Qipengyuania aquimaris]